MSPSLWLAFVAALFLLVSIGITVKRRSASSCPRHQRAAGIAAQYLAAACLLVGLLLAGMAVYPLLSRTGP